MKATHEREKTLRKEIATNVEPAVPGLEILAVELSAPDRFTVFVDHPEGVDHALCVRVTDVLRPFLQEYAIDVSSPGIERPLRTQAHFRNAIGRTVAVRTEERKRKLQGEVVSAGERTVTVRAGDESLEIPYDEIVRGNLVYTEVEQRG